MDKMDNKQWQRIMNISQIFIRISLHNDYRRQEYPSHAPTFLTCNHESSHVSMISHLNAISTSHMSFMCISTRTRENMLCDVTAASHVLAMSHVVVVGKSGDFDKYI